MRRPFGIIGLLAAVPLTLIGCMAGLESGDAVGAPDDPDPWQPPSDLPPTGQIYEEVIIEGQCGKKSIGWVLVDEMCGALGADDYMARFRAPMFRDGVVIGSFLYTVDGTNLWVLDVTNPNEVPRQSLTAGFGTPISMASHGGRLLVAAGNEGLLVVDVTDPTSPVRTATLELEGPALDVHVDGDRAFVATGAAGFAVVDLVADPPAVVQTVAVPGFTAGLVAIGDTA
jgi:hypothetical protein